MGTAIRAEVDREDEHAQETSAWMRAHQELSRLAKERAAADAEGGRWLLAALRSAAHVHLGFGSFSEYVERSFGYKPRSTQEKLRVAEALEELPLLSEALGQGTVHWSAVRELTRVAVPENEREWLAIARGKSVRQLEELVAGKLPGDDPSALSRASERHHVLRFEVAPETFALFREALAVLRRSSNGAFDDDAALLALARLALGGPRDEGRASYQIAVTVCASCGRGQQIANGELVPICPEIVEMAHCDGQQLGCILPRAANDSTPVSSTAPSNGAHVGATRLADNERMRTHVKASIPARERVHEPRAHVGANVRPENDSARIQAGANIPIPSLGAPVLARAQQTIPPALRRAVLLRDQRRCRVPGCRNATFVDVHHLQLRSEGGRNATDNLMTLCGAHHRAAHRGQLMIEGPARAARFRHADGSLFGRVMDPQAVEARAKAFRALRGLGFREVDVRAALAQLDKEGECAAATTERWLRAALARLSPPRSRR